MSPSSPIGRRVPAVTALLLAVALCARAEPARYALDAIAARAVAPRPPARRLIELEGLDAPVRLGLITTPEGVAVALEGVPGAPPVAVARVSRGALSLRAADGPEWIALDADPALRPWTGGLGTAAALALLAGRAPAGGRWSRADIAGVAAVVELDGVGDGLWVGVDREGEVVQVRAGELWLRREAADLWVWGLGDRRGRARVRTVEGPVPAHLITIGSADEVRLVGAGPVGRGRPSLPETPLRPQGTGTALPRVEP